MTDTSRQIEYYEKCFGIIAIEKGYITPYQLIKAITVQMREDIEHGTRRQIGEILLDQDSMAANQIEEVVKAIF